MNYANEPNKYALGGSPLGEVVAGEPYPWNLRVSDRLTKIKAMLEDAIGDQNGLSDRFFGVIPRNAVTGSNGPMPPECAVERIDNQISALESMASAVAEAARSLNQRF